ncbi:MAG TPA: SURF1 family protein [Actinomycetota bacterium]
MLRFLIRPRWIGLTVFVIVAIVACVMLGLWQLARLEGRRALNERILAGRAAEPAPLQELLADGGALDYRPTVATGRYDLAHEVILYGRTLEGQPGNHVLTPLVLADGRAIIVDRGWVPFEMDEPPVAEAAPPDGDVDVSGTLQAAQPGGAGSIDPRADRVTTMRSVDVDAIARDTPYDLVPWFLQLRDQSPASGALPVPEPPAEVTEGPHLSYALQWFAFAAIAAGGYVILVRREVADRRSSAP